VTRGQKTARWRVEDWTALGLKELRERGPAGVTVEALCAAAGRTRGSFYHHFETMDAFLIAMANAWRADTTEGLIERALAERDPNARRKTLNRLANALDHALETGVRLLAAQNKAVADIVEASDAARETGVAKMLAASFGLSRADAAAAARLFHSLHLAAQIRAPHGAAAFVRDASGFLERLLRTRTVT
jgi:AcrR family transcriptional regulator